MGRTDDILRKGFKIPPQLSPSSPSLADGVLSESGTAWDQAANQQPDTGALEHPSSLPKQLVHVLNPVLPVSATSLPLPAGAATLAGQVAATFPMVVDMGDAGAHVAATFIGNKQVTPMGARSMIIRFQLAASTATWQPILNYSYDGINWIRVSSVPTSATASAIDAVLSVSNPAIAPAAFQTTGATLQAIAALNITLAPFWRIEYSNSGATGFTINIAKVLYN